jgi:hypothetical protein
MRTDGRSGFLPNFDLRFVEGSPAFGSSYDGVPRSPRTCLWLNNAAPRPLDFIGLATLCDMFFCRIFHVQARLFPVATVSMTAYFHADADGLATVGDRALLGVADANVFELGFHDQYAQLWSPEGALLATTSQIVNYR